jgi:N-formylmaleamate deformylase
VKLLIASVLCALVAACGGRATPSEHPAPLAQGTFKPTSFRVTVSGAGRPVIFIPGLTCDERVWDGTLKHLGGKVEAHVISLAGFAGNPAIDKPLMPTVRDELLAYIEHNHLERPIIVGHSLGGFMTYWLAETAPDRIAGGIAVDGAPFLPALIDPNATVATAADSAKAMRDQMGKSPDQFGVGVRAFMGSMFLDPAQHQDLIEISAKSDPGVTAEAMYFLLQNDLRPELPKIKAPIVAIVADGGGALPRDKVEAAWRAQLAAIPHNELVIVDKSKHFVMLDQPDAFYAALDAFLAKQ